MSEFYINDKELKITKENYIGYEALYEMQKKLNTEETIHDEKELIYTICPVVITVMLAFFTVMLMADKSMAITILLVSIELQLPALVFVYEENRYEKNKKEKLAKFKEEYPDVDTNHTIYEIKRALKEFEEKLRYEEEYKKFIENERYNYKDVEYFRELDEEIIEQVASKVKQLVR